MIDYVTILSIISFSIIFSSHIVPIQLWKKNNGLLSDSISFSKNKIINVLLQGLKKILNCSACQSFWISLFIIQDIKISLIIYCITYYLNNRINSIPL
jgi:hypothetical protein